MYGPEHSKKQLSREHVTPRGLGNGVIVLKSSCEDCRKKTCAIEDACLRLNWQLFRVHNWFDLSDPKSAPTHGPITVEIDGQKSVQAVPLSQRPNILTMPIHDKPPAILTGENTPTLVKMAHYFDPKDAIARANGIVFQLANLERRQNLGKTAMLAEILQ